MASVNQDAVVVGGFPGGEPVKATVAVALVSVSVAATVMDAVSEAAGAFCVGLLSGRNYML
ncbi:MAG: hypothetical protein ABSC61_04230 [Anaerolineales bacterium]